MHMPFEWDEAKSESNLLKHGVSFENAVRIFDSPVLTRVDRRLDYGETRQISIGLINGVFMLTIVHTARHGAVRLISARQASRKEKRAYVKAFPQSG